MLPYFSATRLGLTIVFVPGEMIELTQPDFPSSWLDIYRSRWDFTRELSQNSLPDVTAVGLTQPYKVQRRFLQSFEQRPDDIVNWISWLIDRFNELMLSSTDPTAFSRDGYVDFVTCFEHGLSIDRLFRKSISAQVSSELVARKDATFEVADIIDELAQYWLQAQPTEHFKAMFHPVKGPSRISNALVGAPAAKGLSR